MDFLCGWLFKHPDVEVRLSASLDKVLVNSLKDEYLHVHIVHDNGLHIAKIINKIEAPFMEIIFDEMYSQLISKGGDTNENRSA